MKKLLARSIPVWLVIIMLVITACSTGNDTTSAPTSPPRLQLEASGVSSAELFAPPSLIDLAQVKTTWSERDLSPRDVEEVYREVLPDGRLLRVVSHTGTSGKHFGAITSPAEGTPVPPGGFPIGLSLAGFGPPFEVTVSTDAPSVSGLPPGITVRPAFRGQRLIVRDQSFESEGPLYDHCDGATDDILALLNVAIEVTPNASELVVAVGGSRGGNTAMLASIRDDRIKRVVSMAGPDNYLVDSYLDIVNMRVSFQYWFLKDLEASENSISEARRRIISCSPLYFTQDLAPTQLHHGTLDINVPFETLSRMEQAWIGSGRDPVYLETYAYEGADHSLIGFRDLIGKRTTAFIMTVFTGMTID